MTAEPVCGACLLGEAVGRREACPGPECPLWEGAAEDDGCVVRGLALDRRLELDRRPDLAEWLLSLRASLGHAR